MVWCNQSKAYSRRPISTWTFFLVWRNKVFFFISFSAHHLKNKNREKSSSVCHTRVGIFLCRFLNFFFLVFTFSALICNSLYTLIDYESHHLTTNPFYLTPININHKTSLIKNVSGLNEKKTGNAPFSVHPCQALPLIGNHNVK